MKCNFMSSALLSVWKKEDTNSEPQSDVMWEGTACPEKTQTTKSFASLVEATVLGVRMKMHFFDS